MIEKIDIEKIIEISRAAGDAILEVYKRDFEVEYKGDQSPLTKADRQSNEVIVEGLRSAYPEIPVVSEESAQISFSDRKDWEYFWMVDPLDGTKEFIKKNGEFTVNIALIHKDNPVLGVVHVPVQRVTYYGIIGKGSFKIDPEGRTTSLKTNTYYKEKDRITVVASRSHLSKAVMEFVETQKSAGKEVELVSAGSSLKLCLVAEGKADVYPRLGPTMEWDTAAAHAVAVGAGRQVLQFETHQPLVYNKKDLLNPWFIVE